MQGDELRITFTQSSRIEVLCKYSSTRCGEFDHTHFPPIEVAPTETEVLQAIGNVNQKLGGMKKGDLRSSK